MRAAGVTQQGDIDCIVAITGGIIEAQISNDPGGTRWVRHLNRLVDLLVDDALTRSIPMITPQIERSFPRLVGWPKTSSSDSPQ